MTKQTIFSQQNLKALLITLLILPVAQPYAHAQDAEYENEEMSEDMLVSTEAEPSESVLTAGISAVEGSFDYVVCTANSQLNVRDESLNKILFTVGRHEPLKPVQSFGTDKKQKVISGTTFTFMKVQFPDRPAGANIGWIAEGYVKQKGECPNVVKEDATPVPAATGWTFPTIKRPTSSYKSGMRRFKASRGGGSRLHAACDLYRVTGEQAVSVNSGTVIRDRYYFYEGTYAIEVKHTGGKVVRYGEITGKAASGVKLNAAVKSGQTVGYIGKVNSGCCEPMLHFEMYTGTGKGALSQSGNKFSRRSDLMDPTSLLSTWEKAKFGKSY